MHKMYSDAANADATKREQLNAVGGIEQLAKSDAKAAIETLYQVTLGERPGGTTFYQPFLTSFCAHKDKYEQQNGLLGMWRAYGRESGYAIVFDVKELHDLLELEAAKHGYDKVRFIDNIYDDGGERFQTQFAELQRAMHSDLPKLVRKDEGSASALNAAFIKSLAQYKHRGFAEEKEIRIVAPPYHQSLVERMEKAGKSDERPQKAIKFRGSLVPYIELFEGLDRALPIKAVIVGPHEDKEARTRKLRKYLDYKGLKIEVRCSEIPFVGI